jgi:ACT domain-containing protein
MFPTLTREDTMTKDQVLSVEYFAITSDDKPGAGADLHKKLAKEGVNLLAALAFPNATGKVQVDLVPENPEAFSKAAKKLGINAGSPKTAFLAQGTDRAGALGDVLDRLGMAKVNVRATCGIACGGNRYGALIWVNAADVEAATRALGAQPAAHHV